jgi:hypothetical protein
VVRDTARKNACIETVERLRKGNSDRITGTFQFGTFRYFRALDCEIQGFQRISETLQWPRLVDRESAKATAKLDLWLVSNTESLQTQNLAVVLAALATGLRVAIKSQIH